MFPLIDLSGWDRLPKRHEPLAGQQSLFDLQTLMPIVQGLPVPDVLYAAWRREFGIMRAACKAAGVPTVNANKKEIVLPTRNVLKLLDSDCF